MPRKSTPLQAGQKFGRLTVVGLDEARKNQYYIYICDCGKEKSVLKYDLLAGKIKSCGCLLRESSRIRCKKRNYKHGLGRTRLCHIWGDMKRRCYNKSHKDYKDYGGRGIIICDNWLNYFCSFYKWAMANGYKDNLSIDRIDNNDNYKPSNCRWVTKTEQNRNKRTIIFLTYKGITLCASQWAKKLGIKVVTLKARLKRGWPIDKALEYK